MFVVYKPRGERADKAPFVSLSKNSIVLNKIARLKLQDPQNVEIAFNKDENMLRIKPESTGLTVKKTKIFSRGLFNYFGIEAKGRYNAFYNEEENTLFVNLNEKPA